MTEASDDDEVMREVMESDEVVSEVIAEFQRNGCLLKRAVVHVLVRRLIRVTIYRMAYKMRLIELLRRRYGLPPRREEAMP